MNKRELHEKLVAAKLSKLERLENEIELKRRLPHIHSQKFYPWQREWFECNEKVQCLTAANQVGKSSTMIKKCIEWAINDSLWPKLWPKTKPTVFWYLYPSKEVSTSEFADKWTPLLPPQDDPEFGWHAHRDSKQIVYLDFIHKGIKIYFKTYAQGAVVLQASSAAAIFSDEEVPEELISEIQARVSATDGYLIFGFTATLGQLFWKTIVEDRTRWTDAWVRQISLFDCMKFEDGSESIWTKDRIQRRIDECVTKAEVQRRIYGKFVKDEGLRFPQFNRDVHLKPFHFIPQTWNVYCGIDYGSGGDNHPSSIAFVAINDDFTSARVIRMWRGDNEQTTAEDVLDKYIEMKATITNDVVGTYYDYSAADIGTMANRRGIPIQKADKGRDTGNTLVAALLKSRVIEFFEPSAESVKADIPDEFLEGAKIAAEFEALSVHASKGSSKTACPDDLIDALRYGVVKIPFIIKSYGEGYSILKPKEDETFHAAHETRYNKRLLSLWSNNDDNETPEKEFEFWNGMLEG